jgi:hypothetical protein
VTTAQVEAIRKRKDLIFPALRCRGKAPKIFGQTSKVPTDIHVPLQITEEWSNNSNRDTVNGYIKDLLPTLKKELEMIMDENEEEDGEEEDGEEEDGEQEDGEQEDGEQEDGEEEGDSDENSDEDTDE